jgi:hypothetical protein
LAETDGDRPRCHDGAEMKLRPILLGLACWACAGCVRAGDFEGLALVSTRIRRGPTP